VTIDPEIGAKHFRLSDMGPDGDASYIALDAEVAYNPARNEYQLAWTTSMR
jgi:hypothetical protein